MADDHAENGESSVPEIELIIKASTIDGRRKGACLFCQEYFMDLFFLAEKKTIQLKVTTVDMQKPPPDFRTNFEATHPPILIDNTYAELDNAKIERYIMKSVPGGHDLFVQDQEVAKTIENLYPKLKTMLLKMDEASTNALIAHLKSINDLMQSRRYKFLTGDTICCFDCELMPRLQHIRVAGNYFVAGGFDIPEEFLWLWRYILHMYKLEAFLQSCPADQDIINHYKRALYASMCLTDTFRKKRSAVRQISTVKTDKHEVLETPTYTTSIPINVMNALNNMELEN